jgi:hypothetical protein
MKRFGIPSIHINIPAFVLLGLTFTWPRCFAQETIATGTQKTNSCGITATAGIDCQCEKKCPNDPDCKCCPNQRTNADKTNRNDTGKKSRPKKARHSDNQSRDKDKKDAKDRKPE